MLEKEHRQIMERSTQVDLDPNEFKQLGYWLVDQIAELFSQMPSRPLTTKKSAEEIEQLLNAETHFDNEGQNAGELLKKTVELVTQNSLYNGHPGFMGYITSSPVPLGALAELLAASVNPNVGAARLSPVATQIERQTIKWIGEFIQYPADAGIMVSGGNMANFVGFVAGMRAKLGLEIRTKGIQHLQKAPVVYVSAETHTWIQKAMDLFGLGTDHIRWIDTDSNRQLDTEELEEKINEDLRQGYLPIMVVGTAGSVSLGVVDPLKSIHNICKKHNLWFHIDGAYGGFAAALPENKAIFEGFSMADSLAIDPHKWLYAPLEVGCTLVREAKYLTDAFSYHPAYYQFGTTEINFVDYGMQNSRGFRTLKVWMSLQHLGINGYQQLIREDIALAAYAYQLFEQDQDFETGTNHLSITTFRYVPQRMKGKKDEESQSYLNQLNQALLGEINNSQEFFISNAIDQGRFLLRMCIVNFRTNSKIIDKMPDFIRNIGENLDSKMSQT